MFPFYNSIFGSKYLPTENWIENGYGPKTLLERLFWPIYSLIVPRRMFDTDVYYGRIGFGYIAAIILVINSIIVFNKRKKMPTYFPITMLYIVFSLIWSNFMMGYIRYALFLEILAGIIIIIFIYNFFIEKSYIKKGCAILMLILLVYQIYKSTYQMLFTNVEFSYRESVFSNSKNYDKNLNNIFKQYDYTEQLKDVDCFAIVDYNCGYAKLLSKDIPVISLLESYNNEYGEEKFNETLEKYKDKNIFIISTSTTYERTLQYLNKTSFHITGDTKSFKTDFLDVSDNLILFKVKQDNDIGESTITTLKSKDDKYIIEGLKGKEHIEFYAGNSPALVNSGNDGFDIYANILNQDNNIIKTILIDTIDNCTILKKYNIDLTKYSNANKIEIFFKNSSQQVEYNDWLTIVENQ